MLLSQVEAKREQLRPSERKLADYVLEAPREVLDLSMTDFAKRAGVSQPTIARFCQALGFSGFREFKIRLAQSVAADVPTVYRDVRTDEPPAGVAAKVLDRTIGALIGVRNTLSSDSVAAAIAILAAARRIEFYGAGGSGIAALDMQHKFFRLGVPSVAYSDPHTYTTSAALLGAGDVVVAISNTGRTRDILDARVIVPGGARIRSSRVTLTSSRRLVSWLAPGITASNSAWATTCCSAARATTVMPSKPAATTTSKTMATSRKSVISARIKYLEPPNRNGDDSRLA